MYYIDPHEIISSLVTPLMDASKREGVGGVVAETADFAGGVVEGEALIGTEGADGGLVEAFLGRDAEVVLVGKVDDAHYAPEVVDPVGVIEGHAPAVGLGREAAQEEDAGARGQEGLERMEFGFHGVNIRLLGEIVDSSRKSGKILDELGKNGSSSRKTA